MSRGALESQALVVPVGGWAVHVVDGSATFDATVAAGTYSPTSLMAALQAALEAGSAETYTVGWAATTSGLVEGGNGQCKITCSSSVAITWTSTDLRDALGYTAGLAASTSYTSDYGVKGLWISDCPMNGSYGSQDPGHTEGGPVQTVSPLGVTKTIVRPTRVRLPPVTWSHVSAARARQQAESGAPRSYERFLRETMFGAVSYFTPGGVVRLIWNADSPGSYSDFYPITPKSTAMTRSDASWSGLYSCSFEGWKL